MTGMMQQKLRHNDSAFTDTLVIKRTGSSPLKIAASMTSTIIGDLLRQVRLENPKATKEQILAETRKIMFL